VEQRRTARGQLDTDASERGAMPNA